MQLYNMCVIIKIHVWPIVKYTSPADTNNRPSYYSVKPIIQYSSADTNSRPIYYCVRPIVQIH